tara:strand:- start:22 stop:210 length:189 start_codon:yes stop_codon:yes gene_type:complete
MLIIESNRGIVFGDVNNPTAQVKMTKDITLGFISDNKDFRYDKILKETVFLLIIFTVTFNQH